MLYFLYHESGFVMRVCIYDAPYSLYLFVIFASQPSKVLNRASKSIKLINSVIVSNSVPSITDIFK